MGEQPDAQQQADTRPAATAAAAAAAHAFRRAVRAEWAAIERHETAAEVHEDRATRLTEMADEEPSEHARGDLLAQAAVEEERAARAKIRAQTALARLHAEGEA